VPRCSITAAEDGWVVALDDLQLLIPASVGVVTLAPTGAAGPTDEALGKAHRSDGSTSWR
jgi:hypothetical protein